MKTFLRHLASASAGAAAAQILSGAPITAGNVLMPTVVAAVSVTLHQFFPWAVPAPDGK